MMIQRITGACLDCLNEYRARRGLNKLKGKNACIRRAFPYSNLYDSPIWEKIEIEESEWDSFIREVPYYRYGM